MYLLMSSSQPVRIAIIPVSTELKRGSSIKTDIRLVMSHLVLTAERKKAEGSKCGVKQSGALSFFI